MMKKNIQIPSNYYISEDQRQLLLNDHDRVNRRRLSNQEKRRIFFRDLNTPSDRPIKRSQSTYIPRNSDHKLCESSQKKTCLKGERSRSMRKSHSSSDSESVTLGKRLHSVDLGVKERYPWLYAVPGKKVMPKKCDKISDEFRRAGIGACFKGKVKSS